MCVCKTSEKLSVYIFEGCQMKRLEHSDNKEKMIYRHFKPSRVILCIEFKEPCSYVSFV